MKEVKEGGDKQVMSQQNPGIVSHLDGGGKEKIS